MNVKITTALLAAFALAAPGISNAAQNKLAAGKYMATLTPAPTEDTADKIESGLKNIQELSGVDAKAEDASLHFTVKAGSDVDESRIQEAVKAVAPGTTVGKPMPETDSSGSMGTSSEGSGSSPTSSTGTTGGSSTGY
jgi:hypothetical protein